MLAGGARRGQSHTPLCPHGAVELTAPPGDRNLRVFLIPSRFSQIGAIRDAAILPTFHVAFGPLAISGASPPRKLCTVSGTSTDGGWNAGRGYRNGNCRQCGSLDLVEALSGNGLRSRTSTRRTQPHRQHRLQRLQRSRSRRAGRACAFTRNAGQRSTTST